MSELDGRTHATRSVIELRKKILSGELAGGTRLLEVPLAEELEISRTPLRDALSRLTEEGLLERGRAGGFVVRRFTIADAIDSIELRGLLEGTAARLAAERGVSDEKLVRIEKVLSDLDDCLACSPAEFDFERYGELNAMFHHELSRLPGSDVIAREIQRVSKLPFASPSAFMPGPSDDLALVRGLQAAHGQHKAIVAAIRAREGTRAEALAREHARTARQNLDRVLVAGAAGSVASLALVMPEDEA